MNLYISSDGVFYTLQGEGISIGLPAVFLRLHHCNLDCFWCDTKYTWINNDEHQTWTIEKTLEKIIAAGASGCQRLVITGGEPLIQQKALVELTSQLGGWSVEIETNGTIEPSSELKDCQFNCSPKLANSGIPIHKRFRPEVLRAINELPNSWFKFVVTSSVDVEEVEEVYLPCISKEKIILSPEGVNQDRLHKVMQSVAEIAKKKGYRLLPRLHVEIWGNRRKV